MQEILQAALEAVDSARVPEELREVAFSQAVALLSGSETAQTPGFAPPPDGSSLDEEEEWVRRIASALDITPETVREVYLVEEDDLQVVVPPSKIAEKKRPATRQLALLVTAGRQSSDMEDWTSINAIRDTVRDFGRLDDNNFSATINDMSQFSRRGTGQDRVFRLTKPGLAETSTLIHDLTES